MARKNDGNTVSNKSDREVVIPGESGRVFRDHEKREEIPVRLVSQRSVDGGDIADILTSASSSRLSELLALKMPPKVIFNGKKSEIQTSDNSEKIDVKWEYLYKRFICDILVANKTVPAEKMSRVADELLDSVELKNLYGVLYELKDKKDADSIRKTAFAVKKIREIFESYSLVFNEGILIGSLKRQKKAKLIEALREKAIEKNLVEKFDDAVESAETVEENSGALEKFVEESQDSELRQMWDTNRNDLVESTWTSTVSEESTKEEKSVNVDSQAATDGSNVDKTQAYKLVNDEIVSSGSSYKLEKDGTLQLPGGFSVHVDVDREGQYYLVDAQFAKGGKVGPFKLEEFQEKAWERFIDAYISQNIQDKLTDPDKISEVDDDKLVIVGKALLVGQNPGQALEGENLDVLDQLIESLATTTVDQNYTTLIDKVDALYHVLFSNMDRQNLRISTVAASIRKKLLQAKGTGYRYSVSELLKEE